MGRKLIVVSNRGPVSFARDADGNRTARRGGGGLVTALRGMLAQHDVTWIASAMTDEDRVVARERAELGDVHLRLLAHEPEAYDRFYNVVANGTLWFLQHALPEYVRPVDDEFREAWESGYAPVNRAFADAVLEELERMPDADVLFQDYHLYLAPAFVRERNRAARMSHFVHIPWQPPEAWTLLPDDVVRAVHEGVSANDVAGFHVERWRAAFAECCSRLAIRCTNTSVNPIGIDAGEFDELRESERVLAEEARIVERRPELLVVRVDRTDPSKNIVRGFEAFGVMLERHPELAGRVGMLALLDPSRQDLPQYVSYRADIDRAAREVNERFGRDGWKPVELEISDNFPRSVAAYKQYDVLLVNAVSDGMNLVAKEGPVVNGREGALVLSRNAGAYAELGEWALDIDPYDVEATAEALYAGLTMPAAERRSRATALASHVRRHGIEEWSERQLADLDRYTSTISRQ